MAALDPRLVRHVRGVRVTIAIDAVLGVVTALLLLAQATLLARTAARAFGGAPLDELAAPSSNYSLKVMSFAALILLPIVLLYQGWTYYVFRRRLGGKPAPPTPDVEAPIAALDPPAAS